MSLNTILYFVGAAVVSYAIIEILKHYDVLPF